MALAIYNGEVVGTGFVPTTIAPEFSTSESYNKNDLVFYMMQLYIFTASKSAGAWDSTKVSLTSIDELYGVDKTKLDGIENNANNYILPQASTTSLGGVKVDGTTVTINTDGVISSVGGGGGGGTSNYEDLTNKPQVNGNTLSGNKTSSQLGLASETHSHTTSDITNFPSIPTKTSDLTNDSNFAVDSSYVHTDNNYTTTEKSKLSGIAENANNYTLPTSSTTTLGGVKVDGTTISINDSGVISSIGGGSETPIATTEIAGKVKPDGTTITVTADGTISSVGGGGSYALPTASENTLGGVKIDGTTITIDDDGVISSESGGTSIWEGTQAEYDALTEYDEDTMYFITDNSGSCVMWRGTRAQYNALSEYDDNTLYIITDEDSPSSKGGIDYSTTEQDTGLKWVDGNKIYQATIRIQPTSSSELQTFSHNLSVKEIVDFNVIYRVGDGNVSTDGKFGTSNSYDILINNASILILKDRSDSIWNQLSGIDVTIQYTKNE